MHPTFFREDFAILTGHRKSDSLFHGENQSNDNCCGLLRGSQVQYGAIQHFAETKSAERAL